MRLLVLVIAAAGCVEAPAEPDERTEEQASVSVCADGETVHGVDVSSGAPDWNAFVAGDWHFAIAKATEGVTFESTQFATNWPAMKEAGVVRGAYCFFRPSPDDPVEEADFFVDTVEKYGGFEVGDIPALDLETLDDATPAQVAADALAWLARVKERTGITPIVYTSPRVFDTLLGTPSGFADYPLWDVTWNGGPPACPNIPASWSGWAFWQYAGDSIAAPGLPGSSNDGDVFNGSHDDLVAFARGLADVPGGDVDAGPTAPDAGGDDDDTAATGDLRGGCSSGGGGAGGGAMLLVILAAWITRSMPGSTRTRSRC